MAFLSTVAGWFGRGGALGERSGQQVTTPSAALVSDVAAIGVDGALQISAVWACVERRATTIASLPLHVYRTMNNGQKELARGSTLYNTLHERPNERMTPFEFWRAMMLNHDLRGNAYARITRNNAGEAVGLWPLPADQVIPVVLADGSLVYQYTVGSDVAILAEQNVLHLKGLGNGTVGLSKLEFMRATSDEMAKAQSVASKLFANGGKPTGVLMVDKVLNKEQRDTIRERFSEMGNGSMNRLYVLEASMKYERLSLTPEDQQLLATRQYGVEEIARWFDVPPVLIHHANVTTWGSGIEQIVSGFHKFAIRPALVSIEQAIRHRVFTPAQRSTYAAEFSFEALLRADSQARSQFYASGVQNGWMTRNEVRQFENLPPSSGVGADVLTAQSNLLPIDKLGSVTATPAAPVGV